MQPNSDSQGNSDCCFNQDWVVLEDVLISAAEAVMEHCQSGEGKDDMHFRQALGS